MFHSAPWGNGLFVNGVTGGHNWCEVTDVRWRGWIIPCRLTTSFAALLPLLGATSVYAAAHLKTHLPPQSLLPFFPCTSTSRQHITKGYTPSAKCFPAVPRSASIVSFVHIQNATHIRYSRPGGCHHRLCSRCDYGHQACWLSAGWMLSRLQWTLPGHRRAS
jgi:hypothetical protein